VCVCECVCVCLCAFVFACEGASFSSACVRESVVVSVLSCERPICRDSLEMCERVRSQKEVCVCVCVCVCVRERQRESDTLLVCM